MASRPMMMISVFSCLSIIVSLLTVRVLPAVAALPLSTNSRWIVDGSGKRVKLACVNWAAHMDTVVAEGLSHQPVGAIAKRVASLGFNCVRLTWATFLATNDTLAAGITVRQSFQSHGLLDAVKGFESNNPSIIDLPLLKAFQAVVSSLADNNVMVILDNHISRPAWCCSDSDHNGWFGDKDFHPDVWIQGLTRMATLFKAVPNVVGMSLRNELRGPQQNVNDWYKYMEKAAEAVHSANPDVLIILSGISYDNDLSFLRNRSVDLTFSGKTVFEVHWYKVSNSKAWENGNPNQVCAQSYGWIKMGSAFLLDQGYPLFLSEFGLDQRNTKVSDIRFLNCFMAAAAELDFEFALWTLTGSYYVKYGVPGMEENYGVLNSNGRDVANPSLLQRLSVVQSPFRGPESESRLHKIIFHPGTSLCLLKIGFPGPLKLGPCSQSVAWSYTPRKVLTILGTYFCIQADQLGKPAILGTLCTTPNSQWDTMSDSKMHLQSKTTDGTNVCLDVDSGNTVVTNSCKCLTGDSSCDPGSQWFKLVDRAFQ